ncbi:MAG: lytic transglycosylase domain-containing protein [Candidatus Adiutrix sp.]|nr:lytic transglycosylase domain-containing protein [Candidatus Adiutrix sp.]
MTSRIGGLLLLTMTLCACNGLGGPESQLEAASASAAATISKLAEVASNPDPRLPARVTLCGETLDLSRRSVYERLEFEFLRVVNSPAQVALWQRRAGRYFPYIEAQLRAADLPEDLKYLAVAESDLRPWVASPAGALGLWQFMPATARHFGLTVNRKIDQRQLPEPLLGAAVSYFKSLKARFGAWSLALAAYNAGDGRIARAVADQGTSDYFDLDLPRETERYVYRIAAIKVVMENAAHYGLNIPTPLEQYQADRFTEKTVDLGQKGLSWTQLAKQLGCDYKTLRLMNPHIIQAPLSGTYVMRLPGGP